MRNEENVILAISTGLVLHFLWCGCGLLVYDLMLSTVSCVCGGVFHSRMGALSSRGDKTSRKIEEKIVFRFSEIDKYRESRDEILDFDSSIPRTDLICFSILIIGALVAVVVELKASQTPLKKDWCMSRHSQWSSSVFWS